MGDRLFWLGALVTVALLGCPQNTPDIGDVALGEYDVRATQTVDDCEIGEVVQDGDFDFRVKLSGDTDSGQVYMIVSVPPSYDEQASVTGVVEDGALVFSGNNPTSLPACGCTPMVSERFAFEPLLAAGDGGEPADGGMAGDGGVDAGPDGGDTPDAGSAADGGVEGLPPASEIVGMGGSLHYEVDTAPACQDRDTDAGTGCSLPCEIRYLLAGTLR